MRFSENINLLLKEKLGLNSRFINEDLLEITRKNSDIEYLQIMEYKDEKVFRLSWAISAQHAKRISNFIFNDPLIKIIEFDLPKGQDFFECYKQVTKSSEDSFGGKHIAISVKDFMYLYDGDEKWQEFTNRELWHLVIGEENFNKKINETWGVDELSNALARYNLYNERKNIEEELSESFTNWLKKQDKQITEIQTEINRVDVTFKIEEVLYFAELKVCDRQSTTRAIRNAIGKLIEYSYYPDRRQASQLIIILDQEPTKNDIVFIESLRDNHSFPLKIGWRTENGFEIHEGI